MREKTYEVEIPANAREVEQYVVENSKYDLELAEVAANPFGDGDRQLGTSNSLRHNGDAIPENDTNGKELPYGNYRPAQIFNDGNPFKNALYVVNSIIDEYPVIAESPEMTTYVIGKVSEAFAFKIQIAETLVSDVLEAYTDYQTVETDKLQAAKDEGNDIDIRMVSPDGNEVTIQVKTNVSRLKTTDADYFAKVDTNDGKATIEIIEG